MISMKSQGASPCFTLSAICRALPRRFATAILMVLSVDRDRGLLHPGHAAHVLELDLLEVLAR